MYKIRALEENNLLKLQNRIHKVGDRFTTVIGISDLDVKDAGELIDDLRNTSKGVVSIQGVCADAVYGIDHILQALKITIESEKRKITLVDRLEMDLL